MGQFLVAHIDDNPDFQKLTSQYLAKKGIDVISFGNTEEFWNFEHDLKYNLILLDYMMPKFDGLESAKMLLNSKYGDVPVVLFTSCNYENVLRKFKNFQKVKVHFKSKGLNDLYETVMSSLQNIESQDQYYTFYEVSKVSRDYKFEKQDDETYLLKGNHDLDLYSFFYSHIDHPGLYQIFEIDKINGETLMKCTRVL